MKCPNAKRFFQSMGLLCCVNKIKNKIWSDWWWLVNRILLNGYQRAELRNFYHFYFIYNLLWSENPWCWYLFSDVDLSLIKWDCCEMESPWDLEKVHLFVTSGSGIFFRSRIVTDHCTVRCRGGLKIKITKWVKLLFYDVKYSAPYNYPHLLNML